VPAALRRNVSGVATRLRRVAILVAMAFLAVAFVRARERQLAEQQRLGDRAQDNAETAARALDAAVLQAQILLQSLPEVLDLAAPPERNDAVLASLAQRIPYVFSNISVVDTTGRNIGSARVPAGGRAQINVADREYFQRALRERQFTVGTPIRGRTMPGAPWVLPFMMPLTDGTSGTVVAFAGASILLDSLDAVRAARQLPAGSVLTVLDSSGTVVIRTLDADRWIGRQYPNHPERGAPVQRVGNDTTVPSDIDFIDRLFGTQETSRVAWRVFVGMPVDVVFGPSRTQFAQDLLLGLFISVGIVFIGYWMTARFVAPIASLTLDAQAISAGDMSRRSQIATDDEVGELARAFNHMADAIVERSAQLAESQAQLRQAQKLEALGAFAGGIAHDFNNYLSSIIGHGELALEQLATNGTDGAARLELDSMVSAANRAAELTRQILVFSRRQVVTPTDFDVNGALLGMQRLLARLLGEQVALQLDLGPGLGGARMDVGQFEQILVNLAINARDAMGGAGTFTVRTSRRVAQDRAFLCIEAEDTGPGIANEMAEKIFEPFFTTKERLHGTGLGLSISYSIIGAAGGTIAVDGSYTRGARFMILLPEGAPVMAAPPLESAEVPLGRQERVLLVDDDPGVSSVAERLLRRSGYMVECAPDADQALQMMAGARYELLITDVVMPGMSGPQLARDVVKRYGPLPVLFISGYPDDDVLTEEMTANHAHFLAKPFTRTSLLRAVRELLDRSASRTT
jgi:signal transduction histidine kinase/ActR/RegA family two-component response regulator